MGYCVSQSEYEELQNFYEKLSKWEEEAILGELSWEDLYDIVFSEKVSKRIYKILPNFSWYDPDTTYQEDVVAFITQFKEYFKTIRGL